MTTIESPLRCARPGPQVPDAMPISIARQVRKWQVRESEVRECVLVLYIQTKDGHLATHDWPVGDVVGHTHWLVSALVGQGVDRLAPV
jgi:hypothetical protein